MTREDTVRNIIEDWQENGITLSEMLNKVYDEFESRTCDNCKYSIELEFGTHKGVEFCHNDNSICQDLIVTQDDGCNKFERVDK